MRSACNTLTISMNIVVGQCSCQIQNLLRLANASSYRMSVVRVPFSLSIFNIIMVT